MRASELRMTRILSADVRRVFDAWSSAEQMSRWFVCDPGWRAIATNEFRIGGKYHVEMRCGDRVVGVAFGEYLEIKPPQRLVFTWSSQGRVGVHNSTVTLELRPVSAKTELALTHNLDPDTREGRAHAQGWEGSLASLERYLRAERREHGND